MKSKLLLLIGGVGVAILGILNWPSPKQTFSEQVWRDVGGDREATIRLQMVDDLLKRDLLKGKPESEIVALLGEPESENYFKDYDFMYRLGGKGLILKSPYFLAINLEGDRFHSAKVLQD